MSVYGCACGGGVGVGGVATSCVFHQNTYNKFMFVKCFVNGILLQYRVRPLDGSSSSEKKAQLLGSLVSHSVSQR